MYGRHPTLPFGIQFGVQTPDLTGTSQHTFKQKLQNRLKWAYNMAKEINDKETK